MKTSTLLTRFALFSAFVAITTTAQAQTQADIDKVNANVAASLAQINSAQAGNTVTLTVTKMKEDDTAARSLALNATANIVSQADPSKKGQIDLAVDYENTDSPRLSLVGKISADFRLMFGADFDSIMSGLQTSLTDLAGQVFTTDKVTVTSTNSLDDAGKIYEIFALISVQHQAPTDGSVDDNFYRQINASLIVGENGVDLDIQVDINPKYSAFTQGQSGLKELIDGLIANSKDSMEQVSEFADLAYGMSQNLISPEQR